MSGILDAFDEIKVVSLPDRTDRRRFMSRQLLGTRFEFFDALRVSERGPFTTRGAFGGVLSHALCLASAKGSILIFEDDCLLPTKPFDVPDCEILWAGWEQRDENMVIGAQCIGYSAKAAKQVAEYMFALINLAAPTDPFAAAHPDFDPSIRPPFDGALMWFIRSHPEFRAVFEPLTSQIPSRSDITPGRFDRIPAIKNAVNLLRPLYAKLAH